MLRYAWLSFHADSVLTGLEPVANGGANWLRLVVDQRFWLDAAQTARFALGSVGMELLLALAIALLLNQGWRGRGAVRALTLLPCSLKTFASVWPSMELEGLLLLRPPARLLGTTGSAEQSSAEASDSAPPVEADEDEASPESEVPF